MKNIKCNIVLKKNLANVIESIVEKSLDKAKDAGNKKKILVSLILVFGFALSGYSDYTGNLAFAQCDSAFDIQYNVGSTINFGSYEQDNNVCNGNENIEWIILAKDEEKELLISKYALDVKPYNNEYNRTTWEDCTLRKWLNEDFLNNAFNEEEQKRIITSTISADNNLKYNTLPGEVTRDKIFILSSTEAAEYLTDENTRVCVPTEYAVKQGAYTSNSCFFEDMATCWWWLRSPGKNVKNASCVNCEGTISNNGTYVHCRLNCVRPTLWLDIKG